ncbi:MAG: exodeoxyribonuclease V subunit alpha [Bacteroidota bacterium]
MDKIDVHKVFATCFTGNESLAYALSEELEDGSICLDIGQYISFMESLQDKTAENPFWKDSDDFKKNLTDGVFVSVTGEQTKPFIIRNGKAYLHRFYMYETQILSKIYALKDRFRVVTGGPGTGKTYSVGQNLIEMLSKDADLKVSLAAPTGKAAVRMEEAIRQFVEKNESIKDGQMKDKLKSLKAETLHRLLGYKPNSVFFRHDAKNPLPVDVVVVDEASMIDAALMAKLLDAIGDETQLYLIGDKDQLASVEAGSVFGDICRSLLDENRKAGQVEKVEKKFSNGGMIEMRIKNFRAQNAPKLIEFSRKLIDGESDFISQYENNNEVEIDQTFSKEKFKSMAMLYKDYIDESDIAKALKKLNKVRFLCVTREYDHSVAETNKAIEKILRKEIEDPTLFSPKFGFYHNQPIIITQNDYNLGLSNGDVGIIRKDEKGNMKAFFEDSRSEKGYKSIPAGYLNDFETVFAMTIHKSQGSEFENVVVLLPEKQARKLLTRELLYTAVTRAKKKVLVQSTREALLHCVESSVSRASGLTERLKTEGIA